MDLERIKQLAGITDDLLFHGGSHVLTNLEPKWMLHGESNNQEGVGIYFSPDIKVAQGYGEKISYIVNDHITIKPSRAPIDTMITADQAVKIFSYILERDENFWYMISDYVEVSEPEDIEQYHLETVWDMMKDQMARDWQLELAMASNVVDFVEAWHNFTSIDGLYEDDSKFYAIINPNIKATPIK